MPRLAIDVTGIVQGVGFRPFVYRLANDLNLTGLVLNDAHGVHIEVQGPAEILEAFQNGLKIQTPPLAQITSLSTKSLEPVAESGFNIIPSQQDSRRTTLISPDIATCPDCLAEFRDPLNRRYHYPFINCTNCGPRYTIIQDIPYDRPHTTMAGFTMCPACQSEYDNPEDRRFHAQPNACPVCGPALSLYDNGKLIDHDIIVYSIEGLLAGKIIAIKGLGGYHLAVDATNPAAVERLRQRKHRFEKPLAVMVADIASAELVVDLDDKRRELLLSPHRPIVLCQRKSDSVVAKNISLDNQWLGMMLPYTPLHELLFLDQRISCLVMTSANISEEPICYTNPECLDRMANIADMYLIHDRDINIRCDDSVQQVFQGKTLFLRRSRGYAPRPLILKNKGTAVLAVGAHLKNTICISRDNLAFISQHIGDLENLETLAVFEQTIDHLKNINQIEPAAVLYDLHPEYLSTKWALETEFDKKYGVQHHYAHILSVMAEHGLEEPVVGIALDGTGYGTDSTIWGGEFLLCDINSFERRGHLEYRKLPGGEKAIKEPWRMAAGYLFSDPTLGSRVVEKVFPEQQAQWQVVQQMLTKNINAPETSSCGRLFDAVAAILDLRHSVSYEGQAAILLEYVSEKYLDDPGVNVAEMQILNENSIFVLSATDLIRSLVTKKMEGLASGRLGAAYHHALIAGLSRIAEEMCAEHGVQKVALSGGCFQNMILLQGLVQKLEQTGLKVYINRQVPANDGGISLGQAYWGMHNV